MHNPIDRGPVSPLDGDKPTFNGYHAEGQRAWDDITGGELDPNETRKARLHDIGYAETYHVRTTSS